MFRIPNSGNTSKNMRIKYLWQKINPQKFRCTQVFLVIYVFLFYSNANFYTYKPFCQNYHSNANKNKTKKHNN